MGNAFSKWLDRVRRLGRRKPEPQDPFASVPSHLRRGPGGRSGAVAVEEPEEGKAVRAIGR